MTTTMTVKQAATRLGLSTDTVYKLLDAGIIPCRRLGIGRGKILIDVDDIEVYWDSSKGAIKPFIHHEPEVRMASHHLRPPSPSRRPS